MAAAKKAPATQKGRKLKSAKKLAKAAKIVKKAGNKLVKAAAKRPQAPKAPPAAEGGFPINAQTRLIVQGITGHQGQFHTEKMLEFGTNVVGGVTPGKGGETVKGVPVFDSCREAVEKTGANASVVYVPAKFTKDAVMEAIDAGIKDVVIITEHVPFHDAMEFVWYARMKGARVLGPNCPGMANPVTKTKIGILPNKIFKAGPVGVASRSGTLTYEIVNALTEKGVGQSGVLGLGGDPVNGTNFLDALAIFNADPATKAIVLVGEIGGTAEEAAAEYVAKHVKKPVFAYIAGRAAPEGKRMGHAGAIVTRGMGTAQSKMEAFRKAGVKVAEFPTDIADFVVKAGIR